MVNKRKKHYQKIDKYKRKYRGNISVGKFLKDFTEGIIVGKKNKTKQKIKFRR
jgi:hypothetical protein